MATDDQKFAPLLELLKAQSKDQVVSLCHDSIKLTNPERIPDNVLQNTTRNFNIKADSAKQVIAALNMVLKRMTFQSTTDPSQLIQIFPENFHKNLKELITKIYLDNASSWQSQALSSQVSFPRLVDFDWRVDVKTASSTVPRMSVPTCRVQFELENPSKIADEPSIKRKVDVELTKEKLETMLDGLGKIRDQLSSVARR